MKYAHVKSLLTKLISLFFFLSIQAMAFENLAYTWRGFPTEIAAGRLALADLKEHASQIDIYSSQAYHIDTHGKLIGALNPAMLKIARDSHIKVMPLVVNNDFEQKLTHVFLKNAEAQQRAIQSILKLCRENHFYGVQIDFEGMSYLDRDAFSAFYKKVADVLHQNGFRISIAIIPILPEYPPQTSYLKSRYRGWSGCYDYKAIGKSSDFVTLMTYDQHGGITPPGPMSGLVWDENIVRYALKFIPANKISLGIPLHSAHWYTGRGSNPKNHIHVVSVDLDYNVIIKKLKGLHVKLSWENADKVHYAAYRNHFLYEYAFLEDADSFAAKLNLVQKYKLRGVSNWCLGEEDPAIWKLLPKHA